MIFTFHYDGFLDGSTIDILDYYSVVRKNRTDSKLLFTFNKSLINKTSLVNEINEIIQERFKEPFDFDIIKRTELLKTKDFIVTMGIGGYKNIKNFIFKNKIFVIYEGLKDESMLKDKRVIISEDIEPSYKMKLAFNEYKEPENSSRGLFLNILDNKLDECAKRIIAWAGYNSFILKGRRHVKNLFKLFDTYLYIDDDKYYNPNPRLFHECYFYNKNIMYITKRKDGAYRRFFELEEGKFSERILDTNDSNVKYLLNQ